MKQTVLGVPIALVGFVFPALAQSIDPSLMQGVEKLDAAFTENFNKQDPAGVARAFTKDGILLSETPQGAVHSGTQAIIQRYDGLFKLGANHLDVTRSQLTSLDNDVAIALGEYHVSGQGQNGPIKVDGAWSATYVRDAGTWKIRLLNIVPKPPPR
jgi:uncharacterized protein (TIGR02246 family)